MGKEKTDLKCTFLSFVDMEVFKKIWSMKVHIIYGPFREHLKNTLKPMKCNFFHFYADPNPSLSEVKYWLHSKALAQDIIKA
jgi:hypothetical protein